MNTFDIFESIKEAFGASTHNHNCFAELLNSIKWENRFEADEEYYFELGDMTFITPSLDPFACDKWSRPGAIFRGNGYIEL